MVFEARLRTYRSKILHSTVTSSLTFAHSTRMHVALPFDNLHLSPPRPFDESIESTLTAPVRTQAPRLGKCIAASVARLQDSILSTAYSFSAKQILRLGRTDMCLESRAVDETLRRQGYREHAAA